MANSHTSSVSPQFNVGGIISLVPHFSEKDVEKYFAHFVSVATMLEWRKDV